MGYPLVITCFSETDCNQKISYYVTIDEANKIYETNFRNPRYINNSLEYALQETIISLKEGFRYDANVFYIISNAACYAQDKVYSLFHVKFPDYYTLAIWTKQYRVITKLFMIDVNFYSPLY